MRTNLLTISWSVLLSFAACFSGCAQRSEKQAPENDVSCTSTSSSSSISAHGGPGATTSTGSAEKAKWVRLQLTSVDIERRGDAHVITVKGRLPSSGWKAEIKALAVTESATREFELVGLPAEGTSGLSEDTFTLSRTERFDSKVEQVLVDSADGATVVPLK